MKKSLCLALVVLCLSFFLFFLSGCGKQCETYADCAQKEGMVAKCENNKCVYSEFVPNVCGNRQCESPENKCTCPADCGACAGKEGTYLARTCVNNECIVDVPAGSVRQVATTKEITSANDKFKLTLKFNQPFNLKKDKFFIETLLSSQYASNTNARIKNIELTGVTKDKRTLVIGTLDVNKNIWPNQKITDGVVLDFPSEKEGELTSISVKVNYDYIAISGGKPAPKSAVLSTSYAQKFVFVNPDVVYPCPESCDDNNPGTEDVCGEETNFFCINRPIAGACGNFVCDASETKCNCQVDCGVCSGAAGAYTSYSCVGALCKVSVNPGVTITPVSLFDDRKLGVFNMQNNYKYNNPFNTNKDKFVLEFVLTSLSSGVSGVKITSVRLLEGSNEIASATGTALTQGQKAVVEISVPALPVPEQEKTLTLGVWYEYSQSGAAKQGSYQKSLGKVVMMTAD